MSAGEAGRRLALAGDAPMSLHPSAPSQLPQHDAYQRLLERPAPPPGLAASGGFGPPGGPARPGRVLLVDFRNGRVLGAHP